MDPRGWRIIKQSLTQRHAAQTTDQILHGSGVEFSRWNRLGQHPLHPSCLQWFQDRCTVQEYARLQRLLRMGELPTVH